MRSGVTEAKSRFLPLPPVSSSLLILVKPSSVKETASRPCWRLSGRNRYDAIMESKTTPLTVMPRPPNTLRSNFRLCPHLCCLSLSNIGARALSQGCRPGADFSSKLNRLTSVACPLASDT